MNVKRREKGKERRAPGAAVSEYVCAPWDWDRDGKAAVRAPYRMLRAPCARVWCAMRWVVMRSLHFNSGSVDRVVI